MNRDSRVKAVDLELEIESLGYTCDFVSTLDLHTVILKKNGSLTTLHTKDSRLDALRDALKSIKK